MKKVAVIGGGAYGVLTKDVISALQDANIELLTVDAEADNIPQLKFEYREAELSNQPD